MKKNRSPGELAAEIAASLMWGPKPRIEIAEAVGFSVKRSPALAKYLQQFRDSGCVYIHGYTPRGREVFGWQTKPFELPDAPRTEIVKTPAGKRVGLHLVTVDGVEMTLTEAAKKLGLRRGAVEYRHNRGLPLVPGDLRKCRQL